MLQRLQNAFSVADASYIAASHPSLCAPLLRKLRFKSFTIHRIQIHKYKLANTNTDAGADYDADEGGRGLDCSLVPIIALPLPRKLKQIRVNQINKMQIQKYLFTNTKCYCTILQPHTH